MNFACQIHIFSCKMTILLIKTSLFRTIYHFPLISPAKSDSDLWLVGWNLEGSWSVKPPQALEQLYALSVARQDLGPRRRLYMEVSHGGTPNPTKMDDDCGYSLFQESSMWVRGCVCWDLSSSTMTICNPSSVMRVQERSSSRLWGSVFRAENFGISPICPAKGQRFWVK